MMMLREKGIFSITQVDYAILEPNGELTVMEKGAYQQPVKKDLQISNPPNKYLPQELIVDGKVRKKNLKENGLDMEWLTKKLKKQGINDYRLIHYAELQSNGDVYVDQ